MSFVVGHPVRRREDFYGRSQQLARFFEMINGSQAQSVSLRGVRRAGKTSFLQYVAHPQTLAQFVADPALYVMVYLDISLCRTPSEFYFRLARSLRAKLMQQNHTIHWPEPQPHAVDVYAIEDLLNQFAQKRIILLLDEFDRLKTGTFDETFLVELRALTSGWEYELACVTASYWDLHYLGTQVGLPPTSPFYNIFHPSPIFVAGLQQNEIAGLIKHITQEHPFNQRDEQLVVDYAGSLPFLIQTTAAMVSHYRANEFSLDRARLMNKLLLDLTPYFLQWWGNLTPLQRDVLRLVANNGRLDELKEDIVAVHDALNHLQHVGLLLNERRSWQINGQAVVAWIRQHGGSVGSDRPKLVQRNNQIAVSPSQLRQILIKYFDMEELRDLCFDLEVDFEQLPGSNKGAKARELIIYWRNRREMSRLITAVSQTRKIPIESRVETPPI